MSTHPPALAAVLALALALACGDDPGPTAPRATVTIVYDAPTSLDPVVAQQFAACVEAIAGTHLHPSWRGFARVDMVAAGGRWTATLADVPVGTRERLRVNDPNVCDENATGVVTRAVSANGVPLVQVVDTPGTGVEPGLAFTVAADGTVTP